MSRKNIINGEDCSTPTTLRNVKITLGNSSQTQQVSNALSFSKVNKN